MTETTNNEMAESAETTDVESQQEAVSDSKLLLAPLAKYGVIALLIVGVIVTTTIMLNRGLDTVEEEIAQQSLAAMETEKTPATGESVSEVSTPAVSTDITVVKTTTALVSPALTPVIVSTDAVTPGVESTIVETNTPETVASDIVAPVIAANVAPQRYMPPVFDHKARIAEHHAYLAKQDQDYLDGLKTRQAEHIQMLQQQLARQQLRIEEIEMRNQETYEMRAVSIKRMQQTREESLNRI